MKIGFPVDDNHLNARVEDRMSIAPWLIVVDTHDMSFEAAQAPRVSAGPGAGIQALTLLLEMEAQTLMVGYIAPHIAQSLESSGIKVITGISGRVQDLIKQHAKAEAPAPQISKTEPTNVHSAFKKTIKQFFSMVPVLMGVILIMGLVHAFLSRDLILKIFSKNPLIDTLIGTFAGSIFAGNPINSYVIGQSLLELGADWAGVCALMMSWVGIGLAQMPAEAHALGLRFTLVRTIAAFVMTILASLLTVFFMGV